MRRMKKGLAVLLAVLLLLPSFPVIAEEPSGSDVSKNDVSENDVSGEAQTGDGQSSGEGTAEPTKDAEAIYINWGAGKFSIVDKDSYDASLYDDYFAEDGSYTIYAEDNAFFPYEVQFSDGDTVTEEWFMSPDSSIEFGGHTFTIESHADGTVPTQISLDVGGDEITVYPEKKEFQDVVATPYSMLPLQKTSLSPIDLKGYTPAELTMVKVNTIFANNELDSAEAVVWKKEYDDNDDYTVTAAADGTFDLSYRTYYGTSASWEMIVGTADQLDADNIRYSVTVNVTESRNWLTPEIYTAARGEIEITDVDYYDSSRDDRELSIDVSSNNVSSSDTLYMSLNVNSTDFASPKYQTVKVFEGQYTSASEAETGTEITEQIWNVTDMTQTGAGYPIKIYNTKWVTMVTYDGSGNATGCLPFYLYLRLDSRNSSDESYLNYSHSNLTTSTPYNYSDSVDRTNSTSMADDGCHNITITLYKEYEANKEYYLRLEFYNGNYDDVSSVYKGKFTTEAEAAASGGSNIKNEILNPDSGKAAGYPADYSGGVDFTLFTTDGTAYQCKITTKTGNISKQDNTLNSSTYVPFTGLQDAGGNQVKCYLIDPQEDSYGSFNYLTIMVGSDVDITNLAPTFNIGNGIKFFSNKKEVESGKDFHNFSTEGAVQYTASSEDGKNQRNYWLQVITVGTNEANSLYINSLEGEGVETTINSGVVTSTREMQLDNYHNGYHDILLINKGADISTLDVELDSSLVQLDSYWTLTGDNNLSVFDSTKVDSYYGGKVKYSTNLAKIRIKPADGVTDASGALGTLTVKSNGTTLMVLNLTGTIGDIDMLDTAPPNGVKYVPYAFMIQNNNKYEYVSVEYSLSGGKLPGGMEIKPNGELYGVPTETGTFTFRIRMYVSGWNFSNYKYKQFSLTIDENTDTNVEASTHAGYELEEKIPDYVLGETLEADSMVIRSEGELDEFQDIWLDGVKLKKDTDYTSESGSTVITILSQTTLNASNTVGTHTLGLEFRTSDDTFHRAAQNYKISEKSSPSTPEENNGSSGGSGSSGSSGGSGGSGSSGNSGSSGLSSASSVGGAAIADTDIEIISYTVSAGDTLWKIAQKVYGSGELWERIYAANTDTITDPDRIYAGQVLRIYLSADNSVITVPNENGTGNITYYTVASGDTLWKISKKFYRRGWRWRNIYNANTGIISNPNSLHVGQVLVIPST